MTSCGLLLEGATPYNNKKQSKREQGKQQLKTRMNIVVAGSGCVLTEAGGHPYRQYHRAPFPLTHVGAC